MKLSEKIALNAEIVSRLMCTKPEISIKDLAELAKEIIEESESVYSKERELIQQQSLKCLAPVFAQSDPSQKEYWDEWKPHVIEQFNFQ